MSPINKNGVIRRTNTRRTIDYDCAIPSAARTNCAIQRISIRLSQRINRRSRSKKANAKKNKKKYPNFAYFLHNLFILQALRYFQ
jgi:hypothetical protein